MRRQEIHFTYKITADKYLNATWMTSLSDILDSKVKYNLNV